MPLKFFPVKGLSGLPLLLFLLLAIGYRLHAQQPEMALHTQNEKARTYYLKASEFHKTRNFNAALENLEDALKKDPQFDEAYALLVRIQELLLPEKLGSTFERILKHIPESPVAAKAWFARAEKDFAAGNLESARESAEQSIRLSKDLGQKTKAMQLRQNIQFVKGELVKIPDSLVMEPLSEELNRFPLQYFPALTVDENFLIFTARKGTHPDYDENIYVARRKGEGWTAPQGISPLVNSERNEGTSSINADARVLVFTKCNAPDGQGSCDIYLTERVGNNWKEPVPIRAVNSPFWDSHPSLSADGRTLYFTSARPGGQGRMDIWCAEKDSLNVWQPPVNLGPVVNTPFDEETPFLHANGQTLYFASDGHPGFGKVDLFSTRKSEKGWNKPLNLGKAINTHRDESGLFITANGRTGLFCIEERRDRELLASEIRIFRVPDGFYTGPSCTFLTGTIFDAVNKNRIQATLDLVNLETGKTEFSMESDKDFGSYTIVLQVGVPYALFASKPGYLPGSFSVRVNADSVRPEGIRRDMNLEPIRPGASITLQNLFFESGKADLLPASLGELRKIGRFLRLNPALKIEIGGHTDDVGQDADNLVLSQKRARAVVDHLQKQGILKERLSSKGFGETQPRFGNTTEEGRAKNRRIEFRVL